MIGGIYFQGFSLMLKFLFRIWRLLPVKLQIIASRLIRPLFQVFAAAVILDHDRRILLVRTTYQRVHPWGLPGGGLEYGEDPEDAVRREVWEETGLRVEVVRLLIANSWRPDRVGIYYLCAVREGEFQPSAEVAEIGFFPLDQLPDVRPIDIPMLTYLYELVGDYELA